MLHGQKSKKNKIWVLSLGIIRDSPMLRQAPVIHSFLMLTDVPFYGYTTNFFFYPLTVNRHLHYLLLLAVINKATLKTFVYKSFQ